MKITICGSMQFAKEMLEVVERLEAMGHTCFTPLQVKGYAGGEIEYLNGEDAQQKIEYDVMSDHYNLIKDSDAILVLNYNKKDIEGYIGGNSFLEMGYAHVLKKEDIFDKSNS